MDRSDKSINKALTAAYKYALFQAFCIPVDSTDSEKDYHKEVSSYKRELNPSLSKAWSNAKKAYKRDGNMNEIKERFSVSQEIEKQLIEECI